MSQCPIMPSASTDPAIQQISQQLVTLQQFYNSPSNLITILNGGKSGPVIIGDGIWIQTVSLPTQIKVEHVGPDTIVSTGTNPVVLFQITTDMAGNKSLDLDTNGIDWDAKGHKIAINPDTESNSIDLIQLTVITAAQVTTSAFQIKTRDIYVLAADDESDWTDIATITNCDT